MRRPLLVLAQTILVATAITLYGSDEVLSSPPPGVAIDWVRQFGTSERDIGFAVHAATDGSVYVGGQTEGPIVSSNEFSAGFLARYSQSGDQLWIRQLDSSGSDVVRAIATDASGYVYVAGTTGGDLGGGLGVSTDAFLRKYDSDGTVLWTRELDSGEADEGLGVAIDEAGNAYISGAVLGIVDGSNAGGADYFVAKYAGNGDKLWARQHGTSAGDGSLAVATDKIGGVYVAGQTEGTLGDTHFGSRDLFVSKYDYDGNRTWTRQLGTSAYDVGQSVSADTLGNIFVAGYTESGSIGSYDGIVGKYDSDGNLQWTRELGTPQLDWIFGVSADGFGNAYVAGTTEGDIEGSGNIVQASDIFISKYSLTGDLQWTKQIVTPSSFEFTRGVSTDGLGAIYAAGETFGNFGAMSAGKEDAFLVKLVVPEPAGLFLLGSGCMVLVLRTRITGQVRSSTLLQGIPTASTAKPLIHHRPR